MDLILSSCAMLSKSISADGCRQPRTCFAGTLGGLDVLHSLFTAPRPSWGAPGSPGNCTTTLSTNLPGLPGMGRTAPCSGAQVTTWPRSGVQSAAIRVVISKKLKIKSKVCWNGCGKVTNAVICNEAVIYSSPLLTVFCQLREKDLWCPYWAPSSWHYCSRAVNRVSLAAF